MSLRYDYLIVGAGLYGATFARQVTDAGKRCLVIDRRQHIAGNCHTESRDGIEVHTYGPHIFHTNSVTVWEFVNRFAEFNYYRHRGLANLNGRLYSLPFTLQTLYEIYGDADPSELLHRLTLDKVPCDNPENLRDQALCSVGRSVYEALIKGYTQKQWGRSPELLPASIIRRLPVRENYCVDYFDDKFQGIPIGGYTSLVCNMLAEIRVELGVDYLRNRTKWDRIAHSTIYTGPLDELYENCFGPLEWRYVKFEHEKLNRTNYQGAAIINFPDERVPFTRITEHKHFATPPTGAAVTWITREYPRGEGSEPAYPVETSESRHRHSQYCVLADRDGLRVGGRLASYRYFDMHQVIGAALQNASRELTGGMPLKIIST
jgi:UDP-galactopyranose mutase